MTRFRLALATLLLASGAATAASTPYQLDPGHTQVVIAWNHFGFSHPTARFDQVDADFRFDPTDPTRSSIKVSIPVDSIDTGVAKLDDHLKSPDFFDVAKYPVATFQSRKVERAGDNALKVSGDLTLHGVTRPVVLDVTINKIGEKPMSGAAAAGFDARATLRRSDFGIDRYVPNVGDEITLAITAEAAAPKADAAGQ